MSFRATLSGESMKPVIGANNAKSPSEIWEFIAVAGDGWLSINSKTPLSYEMKSIALMVAKSSALPEKEKPAMYLELFHRNKVQ